MPRRVGVMKRIRHAWRRLFPRKVYEFEGFDEDNQMSEDDLEEMLSGVSHYVDKMRAEHLKNIDLIRRGHNLYVYDNIDTNQNYFKKTEVENLPDMKGNNEEGVVMEGDTTCIRCEKYGCEVLIQIRPIGQ